MTIDPTNAGGTGIVDRARNILTKPQAEWDRIATEPADVNKLYTGYALPLIVLAAVAGLIGGVLIGHSAFGVTYRVGIVPGVIGAVFQVVAGLIGIFLMAIITNALAPSFGSQQDQGQAHKLAVYGATAGLLGGLLAIFPPIAIIGLLAGIYSLVLIWIGLPRLMKTPEDKRVGYFATIIVLCIVIGFVINLVLGSLMLATGAMNGAMPNLGSVQTQQNANMQGSITVPGGGEVNLGELQKQAEALQNGEGMQSIDPSRLQAQLPQSLPGGFALTSQSSGAAMGTAQAEGVYQNGDARITVTVVHMGAMGAMAQMAAVANVQESRQDANGYRRVQTVDGRVYSEEVDNSARSAEYGVVGHGIAVTASGSNGVSLDQARAAVETIGVQRLEREFGNS